MLGCFVCTRGVYDQLLQFASRQAALELACHCDILRVMRICEFYEIRGPPILDPKFPHNKGPNKVPSNFNATDPPRPQLL